MSDQVVRACLNHWIYRRIGITRILIAVVSVTLITPAQYVLRNRSIAMGRSVVLAFDNSNACLLYTSPSPRDRQKSRMPSSA